MQRVRFLTSGEKISQRSRVRRGGQFLAELGGNLNNPRPVFRRSYHTAQRWPTFSFKELRHFDVGSDHEVGNQVARAILFDQLELLNLALIIDNWSRLNRAQFNCALLSPKLAEAFCSFIL